MPHERTTRPWTRFVAEGFTIVFGILAALWVDAWWDERTERTEERAALQQLAAEFADNAAQLDSVLAIHTQGLKAATVLLGATRGDVDFDADSLRQLILVIDSPWTFNPKSVMAYRWSWLDSLLGESDLIVGSSERIRTLIDRALNGG